MVGECLAAMALNVEQHSKNIGTIFYYALTIA